MDLGLVLAVQVQVVGAEAQRRGNVEDRLQLGSLRDLQVAGDGVQTLHFSSKFADVLLFYSVGRGYNPSMLHTCGTAAGQLTAMMCRPRTPSISRTWLAISQQMSRPAFC